MPKSKPEVVTAVAARFAGTMHDLRALQILHHGGSLWADVDLSMAQLKAMMTLVAAGALTAGDLAQQLGVAPSAVTPIVDKLCAQSLARRDPDATDRRVTWIRPTEAAIALRDRLLTAGREVLHDVMADLTVRELEDLDRGLALLHAVIGRRLGHAAAPLEVPPEVRS